MVNLARLVTREAVEKALDKIVKDKLSLNPSTKYNLVYEGIEFPPKEVVREAAKIMGITDLENYGLGGGSKTNKFLQELGFEIVQFRDWQIKTSKKNLEEKEKLARIVWNENGWKKPSGRTGKSNDRESHEYKQGYGHEEWLLDFEKLIDGYHYGFLEPIHQHRPKYIGSSFNITLYTANETTKERFLIGYIKDAEVLTMAESKKVVNIYEQKGWLNSMKGDLEAHGLDIKSFENIWMKGSLFNIKFLKANYQPFPYPVLVDKNDPLISSYRYILLNRKESTTIARKGSGFQIGNSSRSRNTKNSISRTFTDKVVEIPQLHNKISIGLENELKKRYSIVIAEQETGNNTSVDIAVQHELEIYFYEIKTYDHILTCIRIAVGQLIEYSHFPQTTIASRLYIVSQHIANQEIISYLKHLRKMFQLPLHYICFDPQQEKILQEV